MLVCEKENIKLLFQLRARLRWELVAAVTGIQIVLKLERGIAA